MKIHVLSDLHLEFEPFHYPENDCDIVVLAGDIHVKDKGIRWALEYLKHKQVIYVLGNHEFYGKAYPKHIETLKILTKHSHVHLLEQQTHSISGVNFIGCTLWTDFAIYGDPRIMGYECQQRMSDYKKIRVSPKYSKLRSLDVAMIHRQSRLWLESELAHRQGEKNIVVSHHGPSEQSLLASKRGGALNCAYVSNLESVIETYQPHYWLHGHVHDSSDYHIKGCRVLCNPRGYPSERNKQFDAGLTFEI